MAALQMHFILPTKDNNYTKNDSLKLFHVYLPRRDGEIVEMPYLKNIKFAVPFSTLIILLLIQALIFDRV